MTEQQLLEVAAACGFDHVGMLNVPALEFNPAVREMCAADRCRSYGRCWTCPPYCGTLEECEARMKGYSHGLLLQTVGQLEKTVDTRGYARVEGEHLASFHRFADMLRREYPQALCLGSGGCRICGTCAWPEKCRFPEKACASMEAYGLFVTQVCRDNAVPYYHGPKTITYAACVLF